MNLATRGYLHSRRSLLKWSPSGLVEQNLASGMISMARIHFEWYSTRFSCCKVPALDVIHFFESLFQSLTSEIGLVG